MFSSILAVSAFLLAQVPDTLQTAVVSADRGITVSRTDTLSISKTKTITDVLLQSPALVLADYGGFAGLKSVNLRGLGSPHTAVCIDGIKVGNVQSGQPDLGFLGLENFGGAVIDYAQNRVNFTTLRPVFRDGPLMGDLSLGLGSFGTWLPQGRLGWRLSEKVCASVNAAGIFSEGDFILADGSKRANNDIRQMRGGLDIFGSLKEGEWMAKLYCNDARRGTPGSISWPSTDRQSDRNIFAQGLLKKDFSSRCSISIASKIAGDDVLYKSSWGDSDYSQREFQLNCAGTFRLLEWLDLSAASELQCDDLLSSLYKASRTDLTAIAGTTVKLSRFRADFTLQYEGVFDKGQEGRNVVSPSADLRFDLPKGLSLIGFARRAYRAPTFNELYYPGYGNPSLLPEDAWLFDAGFDWNRAFGEWVLRSKLDFFYNHLTDKIVSAPSVLDPNIWMPYNIGEVRSKGLDADVKLSLRAGEWRISTSARYSFQSADNVPYLSKHTAVLAADASFRTWTADAVWNLRAGRSDSYGEMPDWNSLDIILGKTFPMTSGGIVSLKLNCRNIFDCRYELVTGYPMPGRSLLGSVGYKF